MCIKLLSYVVTNIIGSLVNIIERSLSIVKIIRTNLVNTFLIHITDKKVSKTVLYIWSGLKIQDLWPIGRKFMKSAQFSSFHL